MKSKPIAVLLAAGLSVAGCQEPANSADPTPTPTETVTIPVPVPVPATSETAAEDTIHKKGIDPEPDPTLCGADKLAPYLNLLPTSTAKEEIAKTVGHSRIRYVGPNDATTRDFRPDRLNAVLGVDGRIKKFGCG
jgi:hypothetical protein